MMNAQRQLRLVTAQGIQRLSRREDLIARARRIFPASEAMAAKWVESRLALGDRKPDVEIGIQRIDTSRVVRALPAGSIVPTVEIPHFLRRFFEDKP